MGFDSPRGLGVVAQKVERRKTKDAARRQSLRMHRDRARGVEDPGTGNLSPRQGSELSHRLHWRGFESHLLHLGRVLEVQERVCKTRVPSTL